jgi:hypothetical protein
VHQPLTKIKICKKIYLIFSEAHIISTIVSIIQNNVESSIIPGFIKNMQKIHKEWKKLANKSLKHKNIMEDNDEDNSNESSPKEKKKENFS